MDRPATTQREHWVSWPATHIDWLRATPQLRHGDLVCVVHGLR
jgi:hypothetical protein